MKALVTKRDKRHGDKIELHKKIDDRQANTIPLPFVCKMRCTRGIYFILQTNGSGIVFACRSFRGGNSIFSPWRLSRFVTKFYPLASKIFGAMVAVAL